MLNLCLSVDLPICKAQHHVRMCANEFARCANLPNSLLYRQHLGIVINNVAVPQCSAPNIPTRLRKHLLGRPQQRLSPLV